MSTKTNKKSPIFNANGYATHADHFFPEALPPDYKVVFLIFSHKTKNANAIEYYRIINRCGDIHTVQPVVREIAYYAPEGQGIYAVAKWKRTSLQLRSIQVISAPNPGFWNVRYVVKDYNPFWSNAPLK